jgi:Flp pilus assembly pilin Flp
MAIIGAVSLFGNGVDGMWDRTSATLSTPLAGVEDGDT